MNKKLVYTYHAKIRLKERTISKAEIRACLQHGYKQTTFESNKGVFEYHYIQSNRSIYVIARYTKRSWVIITAVVA